MSFPIPPLNLSGGTAGGGADGYGGNLTFGSYNASPVVGAGNTGTGPGLPAMLLTVAVGVLLYKVVK